MKKKVLLLLVLLRFGFLETNAQVNFSLQPGPRLFPGASLAYSNLNTTVDEASGYTLQSGSFSAQVSDLSTFTINLEAYYDFDATTLTGSTSSVARPTAGRPGWAVQEGIKEFEVGQAIVMEFDLSGLQPTDIQFKLMNLHFTYEDCLFSLYRQTQGGSSELLIDNADIGTYPIAGGLNLPIVHGDRLILVCNVVNSGTGFRLESLDFDLEEVGIPVLPDYEMITIGKTNEVFSKPAVTLSYDDEANNGMDYEFYVEARRNQASFLWLDDGMNVNGAKVKMQLDANNVLTLTDPMNPSNATIVINPNAANPTITIGGVEVVTNTGVGNHSLSLATGSATAEGAIAIGFGTESTGLYAFSSGHLTKAIGSGTVAIGSNLEAHAASVTVLGAYNDFDPINEDSVLWVDTDPLLIVGNGLDATQRSNALRVNKNGKTTLVNKFWNPIEPAVVRTELGSEGGDALVVQGHADFQGNAHFQGIVHVEPGGDIPMLNP